MAARQQEGGNPREPMAARQLEGGTPEAPMAEENLRRNMAEHQDNFVWILPVNRRQEAEETVRRIITAQGAPRQAPTADQLEGGNPREPMAEENLREYMASQQARRPAAADQLEVGDRREPMAARQPTPSRWPGPLGSQSNLGEYER